MHLLINRAKLKNLFRKKFEIMKTRIICKNKGWEIQTKEFNMLKNQALDWFRVHYWTDYRIIKVEQYEPSKKDAVQQILDRINGK